MTELATTDAGVGAAPEDNPRTRVLIARALVITAILAIWQGSVSAGLVDAFWVSSPALVVAEMWRLLVSGELIVCEDDSGVLYVTYLCHGICGWAR